jgi:hypothetical protein
MAKTPDEIVAEIDRKQIEEDKDLPRRVAKAAINLVKPKSTKPDTGETTNPMGDKYNKGGKVKKMAFGGLGSPAPQGMPQRPMMNPQGGMGGQRPMTPPPTEAQTLPPSPAMGARAMKKGGSASSRADGIAIRGKTRA